MALAKITKKILWTVVVIAVLAIGVVVGCQLAVVHAAKGRLYSHVDEIPHREVALLLGTSPIGRSGRPNQFFLRRIDASVALFEAGKIDRFIISGAKREDGYDETEEMRHALMDRGIPDSLMVLDGEGFRTIHSVKRVKEVFCMDSVTIISQRFHNERAVFLSKHSGLDAIAYNAETTSSSKWRILMRIREYLARVKAVYEVM